MSYIVARTSKERIGQIGRYLYGGQKIITAPVENAFGSVMVVIEAPHGPTADMVVGRLQSGLIGATQFETLEQAKAYIESER